MLRLLHLADVHLDTPFAGRSPTLRARLRQASRDAFQRAVDVALAEKVDAVLLAGDLFDGSRLSFETERFLLDQLGRLDDASVPVVYATGNHDPGRAGARTALLEWPANVTLVPDEQPRRVAIRRRDGAVAGYVTAAGHAGPNETRDLAAGLPSPQGALPEVALLHTQVVGARRADDHRPYAPTTVETFARSGFDYWALGHVHTRQEVSAAPAAHYPGNLQGRTHAEAGARGGLLVEVGHGVASVEFRPLAAVRWETVEVRDPVEAHTLDGLVRAVLEPWAAARRADPDPDADWMVRVILQGGCPLWQDLARPGEAETLARELRESLGALDVELHLGALHAPVDADAHADRDDVLGVAIRRLRALAREEGPLPPDLETELAGWAGDAPDDLRRYVASLLDDADGELAAQMLVPEGGER